LDGEVPSPWRERLAAHISSCPECAARVEGYGALRGRLADSSLDEAACVERIKVRLGEGLDRDIIPRGGRMGAVPRLPRKAGFWGRNLALPLPIAAAAAAAFVLLGGLAFSSLVRPAKPAVQTLAVTEMAPNAAQSANMEALVKYLESQDTQVNLTIQLPTGTTFDASGQPLVVRAADVDFQPIVSSAPKVEGRGP